MSVTEVGMSVTRKAAQMPMWKYLSILAIKNNKVIYLSTVMVKSTNQHMYRCKLTSGKSLIILTIKSFLCDAALHIWLYLNCLIYVVISVFEIICASQELHNVQWFHFICIQWFSLYCSMCMYWPVNDYPCPPSKKNSGILQSRAVSQCVN